MPSLLPFVINLVNTAFGVTVLAVPYCFHQCGLILGGLLLLVSSYATKKSCSFLLKASQISRKHNIESLGFHVGGFLGKFIVEMSLIGYLVGTAIAWFVIIGDVAPAVVSSIIGLENTLTLRYFLIVVIGIGVVLPLSLVKDINSLTSASNIAIAMYAIFVLQLFLSTMPQILFGDWMTGLNFWRPEGVLQCLPIFGISFLCQTVIFVLYDALPEPSVTKMEYVVNHAMNIVLLLSFTVGFCGYVRFYDKGIEGDLLNNYTRDFISEFIRLGFCVSTILSFPLLVFPCRSSINSMISTAGMNVAPVEGTFIPHDRFFTITCALVIGTVTCGMLFPSVEFVMALVGATMGAMLTYILPSYIFLKVTDDDYAKTEAKVLLVVGICLLCLSTFSVLSVSESHMKNSDSTNDVKPFKKILDAPAIVETNNTMMKTKQGLQNLPAFPSKLRQFNKSVLVKGDVRNIAAQNGNPHPVIMPQSRTAKVIQESRREPVLPESEEKRQLPKENDISEKDKQSHDDNLQTLEVNSINGKKPLEKSQNEEFHRRVERGLPDEKQQPVKLDTLVPKEKPVETMKQPMANDEPRLSPFPMKENVDVVHHSSLRDEVPVHAERNLLNKVENAVTENVMTSKRAENLATTAGESFRDSETYNKSLNSVSKNQTIEREQNDGTNVTITEIQNNKVTKDETGDDSNNLIEKFLETDAEG